MAERTESDYQQIVSDVQDILDDSQLTYQQRLHDILEWMDQNELYGCTDTSASNYCNTCIYSTDTCLYAAPPETSG